MVTLLVGHRGTGKTAFLAALARQAQARSMPLRAIDLDAEIEQREQQSLDQIWQRGETAFRQLETETLRLLLAQPSTSPTVIALGAGFLGPLPTSADVHVLWLRRSTDMLGRSFQGRPRLNAKALPLEEYLERWGERERRYRQWAHEELWLPEGYSSGLEDFVLGAKWNLGADLTLLPEAFRDWPTFTTKRQAWGWRRLEVRDDLLSPQQIELTLATLPRAQILYAHRHPDRPPPSGVALDWALELGQPPASLSVFARSLHQRGADFQSGLRELSEGAGREDVLKLAVEVHSFSELEDGHKWWSEAPHRRAFLPRSSDGRWRWYRSLFGPRMPLHFLREGDGSALDQPGLWQACLQPQLIDRFAAVLGQPVDHSRTPLEQREFFAQRQIPVVAIPVAENEFHEAWPVLLKLGLRFAAITAPLKKMAFTLTTYCSAEARGLESVNTIFVDQGLAVHGENTDVMALRQIASQLPARDVWLWGGGGVRASVKAAWPNLREISAREGVEPERVAQPDLLVWAAGRRAGVRWPPTGVRPKMVLDLNYSEDSPGLEWAVHARLPYQSGVEMFQLQAAAQRGFWLAQLEGAK